MSTDKNLKGLGGWLILVGIGVAISPVRLLMTLFPAYRPIFTDGTWGALTTPGSEAYHSLWAPFLIGEIGFNLLMLAASVYLIYLFFSKHYLFPKFYIGVVIASLIFIPLDSWVFTKIAPDAPIFDPATLRDFARTLVGALIWIPYMLVSKRVKATFVENKPESRIQPASEPAD